MSNIDKQALLGPDKHSNQHKLSRLIAEANSAEIRDIAEAVEQYTDQLIAALEAEEKHIAELESKNSNLRTIAHERNELAIRANLDSINDAVEMDRPHKRIAELERSETQLISERDDAESALNDAYKAVMGQAPEWSNWFSFADAIDEIELACELWRNQTDDVIQFRQRIADLETQKADLMEHVLNGYEATALTMTLRKMDSYLPDYLRFCGIYGVEHDAIIDKLDYQSFVLKRLKNGELRQDIEAGTGKEEQA